jgi:hypothetical protein
MPYIPKFDNAKKSILIFYWIARSWCMVGRVQHCRWLNSLKTVCKSYCLTSKVPEFLLMMLKVHCMLTSMQWLLVILGRFQGICWKSYCGQNSVLYSLQTMSSIFFSWKYMVRACPMAPGPGPGPEPPVAPIGHALTNVCDAQIAPGFWANVPYKRLIRLRICLWYRPCFRLVNYFKHQGCTWFWW